MSRLRKYGGIILLILAFLIAAQVGVSFFVRTHRVRGYLIAHLERAFGRPVQVGEFSVQLLPMPELDVEAITIGEDPAFGPEYFLRAERMTASLRWSGLLRRHFEFGTMSLTRPSLILVRNAEGRWNLEDWLPPSRAKAAGAYVPSGPQLPPEPTHRLQKIEFDEGRINFKVGDEKRPFAFIQVSGSVEQMSPGRWQLRLEAQPWRSGVALQSTGTLQVAGDVAGTSARLQPAQLRVHWANVSLADLFRLATGNDSGVRGVVGLDGNASVGSDTMTAQGAPSPWRFQVEARAAQIHRWDLTERSDNPQINLALKGFWDLAAGEVRAEELSVEMARSNMSGSGVLKPTAPPSWHAQLKSMNVEAADLLAWYRAFQPGISDDLAMEDFITGNLTASGWPLKWEEGALTAGAGTLRAPGIRPARVDPFHGSVRNGKFDLEGPRVKFAAEPAAATPGETPGKGAAKLRNPAAPENSIEASIVHDSMSHQGGMKLNLRAADSVPLFKLAAAFGHVVNQGWEYTGGATGSVSWNWGSSIQEVHRTGTLELTKAQLQIAGLNQPLKIAGTRLEWKDGRRSAEVAKAEAFGAEWSGTISEAADGNAGEQPHWQFQLHADHLDATELDRWFGPRARPNWLQRLLPSLLGGANPATHASELLRQVSAEGELTADSVAVEKIKLTKAHAKIALHDLQLKVREADAEWAGGTVHGEVRATFSPVPKYDVAAEVERVELAQLPWTPRWAERWGGTVSAKFQLTTNGVGRDELLKKLAGQGELKLAKVELRGWDVESSAESGTLRTGVSRWPSGSGEFTIGERTFRFEGIQLDAPHQRTQLAGTIGFDMSGHLTFRPETADKRRAKVLVAAREFSLSGPLETPKAVVQPVTESKLQP
jgi:AsmA-like protein